MALGIFFFKARHPVCLYCGALFAGVSLALHKQHCTGFQIAPVSFPNPGKDHQFDLANIVLEGHKGHVLIGAGEHLAHFFNHTPNFHGSVQFQVCQVAGEVGDFIRKQAHVSTHRVIRDV